MNSNSFAVSFQKSEQSIVESVKWDNFLLQYDKEKMYTEKDSLVKFD